MTQNGQEDLSERRLSRIIGTSSRTTQRYAIVPFQHQEHFNGNQNQSLRYLMEQMNNVCNRQDIVIQQINELRAENRNFQSVNNALVAMNASQCRIIQDLFASHKPIIDEMLHQFHTAENIASEMESVPTNNTMWSIFQGWIPLKKTIFMVICAGITVMVGSYSWKFIGFFWEDISNFIIVNGPKINNMIQDLVPIIMKSDMFKELTDSLRVGSSEKLLSAKTSSELFLSTPSLTTILTIFLTFISKCGRSGIKT